MFTENQAVTSTSKKKVKTILARNNFSYRVLVLGSCKRGVWRIVLNDMNHERWFQITNTPGRPGFCGIIITVIYDSLS
jgi:hypothetical protein